MELAKDELTHLGIIQLSRASLAKSSKQLEVATSSLPGQRGGHEEASTRVAVTADSVFTNIRS